MTYYVLLTEPGQNIQTLATRLSFSSFKKAEAYAATIHKDFKPIVVAERKTWGEPVRGKRVDPDSRKSRILALEPGESMIFLPPPGMEVSRLMTGIASSFNAETWAPFSQKVVLLVVEGELPQKVVRVTRKEN